MFSKDNENYDNIKIFYIFIVFKRKYAQYKNPWDIYGSQNVGRIFIN